MLKCLVRKVVAHQLATLACGILQVQLAGCAARLHFNQHRQGRAWEFENLGALLRATPDAGCYNAATRGAQAEIRFFESESRANSL